MNGKHLPSALSDPVEEEIAAHKEHPDPDKEVHIENAGRR